MQGVCSGNTLYCRTRSDAILDTIKINYKLILRDLRANSRVNPGDVSG